MTEQEIRELINRRRRQIMVHSTIYYVFGSSIISDKQFDNWAYELADLQKKYYKIAKEGFMSFEFMESEFDGTTGFHLPTTSHWAMQKAQYIMDLHKKYS